METLSRRQKFRDTPVPGCIRRVASKDHSRLLPAFLRGQSQPLLTQRQLYDIIYMSDLREGRMP